MNKTLVVVALLSASIVMFPNSAEACSCSSPSVMQSYASADDVMVVRVVWSAEVGPYRWYVGRTRKALKGCIKDGSWVYLRTASSSAACGAYYETGKTYLINGWETETNYNVPVLSVNSCSYDRKVGDLTKADVKWLLGRYNSCTATCVDGTQPVNCFANPCEVASCPLGQCEANYCGGCNAEFYYDGVQVCGPCASDQDCKSGQTCGAGGQCSSGCTSNKDCDVGYWCSPTPDDDTECKPFQQEGEYCGGFTPIWAQSKCEPPMVCTDTPPLIADAPGKCRTPCEGNANCPKDQYCSNTGVCRDDGACWSGPDCEVEGNAYNAILCVGYGVCSNDGMCGWKCGDKVCQDLSGINFGFCDAVLGVGIVNGKCAWISGCEAPGYELFKDMASCNEVCLFSSDR